MNLFEFPLILSGPILRRVEPTRIYIWIATSKPYQINAELYKIDNISGDQDYHYHTLETVNELTTIKLGKQLYINLVKVTPMNGTFPLDTLLGYNLQFERNSELHDLESLQLLTPDHPESIVYGTFKYPTFHIKSGETKSNILYGSCRKLHGAGEDTLALADTILKQEYENINNRPDSLFLMGDQIYADDVANPIIRIISSLGDALIGQTEPLHQVDSRLDREPFRTALTQINGRQYIIENLCQFTSSQSQNHLMKLGEFSAMYLLSWSPVLWEAAQEQHLFQSFDEAKNDNLIHFVFPNEERNRKEYKTDQNQLKSRYLEQEETLITTPPSLYSVRRLLANIPTYMIFDDHDITDDWNITANWKTNVFNALLGRHVIANGLTAYWAFQGWGNDPDTFEDDFLQLMKSYLKTLRNGNILTSKHEKWVINLWNFNSWHFVAPTHPKAVFLDTRTQREYDLEPQPVKFGQIIEETTSTPQLLSEIGWSHVTNKLLTSDWNRKTPLIVVSATPVYGMGLIESFLHDFVYPFKVLGVDVQTSFDFEAWKYNGRGFTELLNQVAEWNPSQCIFLSGDVHYASAVKATVTFADGRELDVHQFTSSPFKNMSFSGIWGSMMKTVITVNSMKRKKKDIHRICDPSYTITHVDEEDVSRPFLWKDQLRYQFLRNSSIIETNNNLGLLSISAEQISNNLHSKR
ncbi:hypothetical protein [Neobacillus drentensis]|uniref:hypothetical protein n=1 Tax=Neobacillus drentensis TaxID=220684 RepID=UPI000826ACB0|nr:hypothetical protein [Neobacillus drentensis]